MYSFCYEKHICFLNYVHQRVQIRMHLLITGLCFSWWVYDIFDFFLFNLTLEFCQHFCSQFVQRSKSLNQWNCLLFTELTVPNCNVEMEYRINEPVFSFTQKKVLGARSLKFFQAEKPPSILVVKTETTAIRTWINAFSKWKR